MTEDEMVGWHHLVNRHEFGQALGFGDGLKEAQDGLKIAGRNINNLRYADDTTLMAESEEELKSLDESERGE